VFRKFQKPIPQPTSIIEELKVGEEVALNIEALKNYISERNKPILQFLDLSNIRWCFNLKSNVLDNRCFCRSCRSHQYLSFHLVSRNPLSELLMTLSLLHHQHLVFYRFLRKETIIDKRVLN
jgi:hypothetical protein